jgi:hypothetical protein
MSITTDTPLTRKEIFLQYFEHSPYKDFSFWKDFTLKALDLYKDEFVRLKDRIKNLDAAPSDKMDFDDNGIPISMNGWDVCEDEAISHDRQHYNILPLMFIGAYNDFEKGFKDFVVDTFNFIDKNKTNDKINSGRMHLENEKKFDKIKDYKKALCLSKLCCISESKVLNNKWIAIDNVSEVRNVFAHNENPIPAHKDNRIEKIRKIVGVAISQENHVTISDVSVIIQSCILYEDFMENLISEIANKLAE